MNIGFYRASLIGDNMVALYGIYAMKCLHPDATLIVYTNAYGINLYSQFHFIDVLIDVGAILRSLSSHSQIVQLAISLSKQISNESSHL
ncbi:hypothetical protein [uncultured Helicobacter sp.]|uniref:hypothetical protein n=1 Tax=uncultured Helicobacter sp. TaxID=175537 RepID=UPI00261A46BD|nr:hypothetical protein [uncultured Helicobacter sp.]